MKADLCITPSLMQRIEDRAAKFKVDDVLRDLAVRGRLQTFFFQNNVIVMLGGEGG